MLCVKKKVQFFTKKIDILIVDLIGEGITMFDFNSFFLISLSSCDAAEKWQIGFQDPATPIVEGMHDFHNYLLFFSIVIGVFVCFVLIVTIIYFKEGNKLFPEIFTHSNLLEIIWTLIPALFLVAIAIPSFSLLYSLDEFVNPSLTLKVLGHQWYWSYEYSDYFEFGGGAESINFDSYMLNENDLPNFGFRLLEVDNRVMLPILTHIRLLISSSDVLHSWSIPSFGIKVDACPGRLSQVSLFIKRSGVYYGQCSEICGVNHGFMPIVVKGVMSNIFTGWIFSKIYI